MKKKELIITTGKRKKSIARAVIRPGKGVVRVNQMILSSISPVMVQLRMKEPLIIAGDISTTIDLDIKVEGGGVIGQADAVRTAIARALIEFTGDEKLKEKFVDYDRGMVVSDMRQRESRKPNTHGNARGKVQKSYR